MIDFDPNKDYYAVLGVSEDAAEDEIKKAFRKAAMKHHPDKGGDQEKFKEINSAYQVIGDKQKRQQYDTYRKGGFGAGGMGGFDFGGMGGGGFGGTSFQVEDIFDVFGDFFGGGQRAGGGSRRKGPRRGQDIVTNVTISFEESFSGVSKEIKYVRYEHCEECGGKGISKDSQKNKCSNCDGKGVIQDVKRTPFGAMQVQTTCNVCHGEGYTDSKPCDKCEGAGLIKKEKKIKFNIPAGIDDGQAVKMPGMGNYGPYGGEAGDLYIKVLVSSSKYKRHGVDIYSDLEISIYEAVLGVTKEVDHPDGKIKVKIPKGLQVGDMVRLSGKGFPATGSWSKKGDFIIVPKIKIPKKLSKKEEKLWKELSEK